MAVIHKRHHDEIAAVKLPMADAAPRMAKGVAEACSEAGTEPCKRTQPVIGLGPPRTVWSRNATAATRSPEDVHGVAGR